MENIELLQTSNDKVTEATASPVQPIKTKANSHIHPADADEQPCPTCSASRAGSPPQYIYAIGRIQPRFPSLGIEKEFAQAIKQTNAAGLTDNEALYKALSEPQNRYLARNLCWVFSIQGLETYLLQPMNPVDLSMLIESLQPSPKLTDVNIVIGVQGPIAPPHYCNGLQIPIVGFDQIYSFDVDSLLKSIPKPTGKDAPKNFSSIAEDLFMRIMQMTDNAGATDDHRALNYLSVRYNAIYATAANCYTRNCSLTGVEVRGSALSSTRNIVEVIFTFTNRNTDVDEKYYCRVDVTEEFPFLVTKMQSYFDR
jgi:hypothetical protein